jgi:hypothetical protein
MHLQVWWEALAFIGGNATSAGGGVGMEVCMLFLLMGIHTPATKQEWALVTWALGGLEVCIPYAYLTFACLGGCLLLPCIQPAVEASWSAGVGWRHLCSYIQVLFCPILPACIVFYKICIMLSCSMPVILSLLHYTVCLCLPAWGAFL